MKITNLRPILINPGDNRPNWVLVKDVFGPLPQMVDGHVSLPARPGLGIEIDEEAAAAYGCQPWNRRIIVQLDGSIGH